MSAVKKTNHATEQAENLRVLEALIFAAEKPLSLKDLEGLMPEGVEIESLLEILQERYKGGGFHLVESANRWSFRTASDMAAYLKKEKPVQRKLTRATIETLAIVAYHQPVTRADIEQIRGVSVAQGTLDILLEAGWVKPGPRRETPGRPMTWLTTDDFLHHFGLAGLEALPGFEELKASGLLNSAPPPGIAIPESSGGQGALPLISEALAMPELNEDSAGDEEI